MPDERPRNFIERLPEIIEREETDISHLDEEMVEILYPERADTSFRVTLVFGPPAEDADDGAVRAYEEAVSLAQKSSRYRSEGDGRYLRHHASFGIDEVNDVHDIFYRVSEHPTCDVLVRGKRVPYGRELWLPLLWFFKHDPMEA